MTRFLSFILLITLVACSAVRPKYAPKTEFRGFWVATVVNIDWPRNNEDSVEKQKMDYLKILDFYDDLHFNAAIVQIRAAGDSFYDSEYAPWSRFLTGKEGKAPKTNEDILEWMITETHKRGMEFHAWLNPYRATFDLKTEHLSATHDFHLHPEWMVRYGKKFYYNPGLPRVRKKLVRIMDEVISKYDIDAIHFDDYFYPYKIDGEVFNDSIAYYNCKRPDQSLADWRRSNVDSLVQNIHKTIKEKKPWVQFGVSPFGVWKNKATDPNGSHTQAGQTTYEDLYADPLLWMQKGWLDYLVPQVYWSMELPVASHREIVGWWAKNKTNTNLYIGNGPYKIRNNSDKAWDKKKELPKQLQLARETNEVAGNVFFSAKSLMTQNPDVVRYMKRNFYKYPSLPPVSPLTNSTITNDIALTSIQKKDNKVYLNFNNLTGFRYAMVYIADKNDLPDYSIKKLWAKKFITETNTLSLDTEKRYRKKYVAITFIDTFGNETSPIHINLKPKG